MIMNMDEISGKVKDLFSRGRQASKEALEKVYPDIVKFANNEQLTAHANSIKVRFE